MFASSNAALRYYAESKPHKPANTTNDLLRLVSEENPEALAALTKQAEFIGDGLAMIAAALAPEVMLIAGDVVASAWERIRPIIQRKLSERALARLTPKLLPTHEAEMARLRGAAIIILQRRSSGEENVNANRGTSRLPVTKTAARELDSAAAGALVR